ncbi:MAG TPA: carbohydrate binding domain-containing protein, partial [Bacteroidota bacterium]|nr:carbohydrate binding domain-containing protein [Bacteroidota bacterium]
MKICIIVVCFIPTVLAAQTFTGGFAFTLPSSDTTAQPFLPLFPAVQPDDGSFIGVSADGHFVQHGKPLRFWGTNIVATGAFPDTALTPVIAGRLRKMGFNLVRFHHLDNAWGDQSSLFDWQSDTRHFNADRLNKLERLIAELKKNGIYANINLHVGRVFSARDGVPDADSIAKFGPEMSKGIYYFDPQLRALNKEYATQLLTHVNPFTGMKLAVDPVMAMVELTNEDMLMRLWRAGSLRPYAMGGQLTIRHTRMLDSLWNVFLKNRYGVNSVFAAAWNNGAVGEGSDNLVPDGGFETLPITPPWQLEQNNPTLATGTLSPDPVRPAAGALSGRATVTMTDRVNWHIQLKQTGLTIVKDSTYVVKFSARADSIRSIDLSVMKESSPYTGYAWLSSIALGTDWKTYSFTFKAPATNIGDVRLAFQLGAQKGVYWFDDVTLARGGITGVPPGEDLDRATVRRVEYSDCQGSTDQRVRDISEFYLGLSRECLRDMKSFLRDSLGVRAPVTGTNWFADQAEIATQSEMDYIDNHAYWDHPTFPSTPWSPTDWLISNTAMVKRSDWSTFPSLVAGVGIAGKPFTISEYNHPFPNRYQVEGPLFLASYSSFHDVDGIMIFDYNGAAADYTRDDISGYFDIHRNTAMMSLMPSLAFAYRNGLIATAKQTLLIDFSEQDILQMPKNDAPVLFNKAIALEHGLRASGYASTATTAASLPSPSVSGTSITDTREIVWDNQGMLTVATPRFASAAGFFTSMPDRTAGAMTV